jgi:hypothetical protein
MWGSKINEEDEEIQYPFDGQSLLLLRRAVNERGSWGWYIWDAKDIPKDRSLANIPLPVTRTPNLSRRSNEKDVIYQKWRSKYNNENLTYNADAKEKKRLARQKTFTGRRLLALSRDRETGETVNEFGTLVGILNDKSVPRQNMNEHQSLMKKMKESKVPRKEFAAELIRLWETHYAAFNGITQSKFRDLYLDHNLCSVSNYMYYESYALKICQLKPDARTRLTLLLYDFAAALPKIFEKKIKEKRGGYQPLDPDVYETAPLLSTLIAISNYFDESLKMVVCIGSNANGHKEVLDTVYGHGLCNVILDFNHNNESISRRFGVACQGIPFIKNLSESEAVFVFATSPDVFGFRPDRDRQPKANRINSLIEFLRRSCLGIQDDTETIGLNEIKE